jgi:hypothetical protein
MAVLSASKGPFTVRAYVGDFKTLLAFNFANQTNAKNLAGFTIQCQPPGEAAYYLFNELQFQDTSQHAQIATEPARSTINAPIQKYRWTHVPGQVHQGVNPVAGNYIYTITPRYFNASASMQPLDASLSVSLTVPVNPFKKGALALGFTRGYMQSEAFLNHFGRSGLLQPKNRPLQFDTGTQAGTDPTGKPYTFADEYTWLGSSARVQTFNVLHEVLNDPTLTLDVFAYDLNEPDVVTVLLQLAAAGRVRVILDDAKLHVGTAAKPTPEDQFTTAFNQQAEKPAAIVRGCFARYSHDKIFIVSKNGAPTQVLTGSTNFSITGLYVNANHVLVFDDANLALQYSKVFEASWQILQQFPHTSTQAANDFATSQLATQPFAYQSATVPRLSITFSPHTKADVSTILGAIAARINQEATVQKGSVFFAVMQLTGSQTPVYQALDAIHTKTSVVSYGISDAPQGTFLYAAGSATGILVTGKPGKTTLPPPFDQVVIPPGHEIHDKFVVCGLNGPDPVVYCGSSNLATGGENQNGDNLLQIHDPDVATVFAIEAILLVDHYNFLDRYANPKAHTPTKKSAVKKTPAKAATKTSAKRSSKKSTTKKATAKKRSTKKSARKSTRR